MLVIEMCGVDISPLTGETQPERVTMPLDSDNDKVLNRKQRRALEHKKKKLEAKKGLKPSLIRRAKEEEEIQALSQRIGKEAPAEGVRFTLSSPSSSIIWNATPVRCANYMCY